MLFANLEDREKESQGKEFIKHLEARNDPWQTACKEIGSSILQLRETGF
jgi:hypothetical protein